MICSHCLLAKICCSLFSSPTDDDKKFKDIRLLVSRFIRAWIVVYIANIQVEYVLAAVFS